MPTNDNFTSESLRGRGVIAHLLSTLPDDAKWEVILKLCQDLQIDSSEISRQMLSKKINDWYDNSCCHERYH